MTTNRQEQQNRVYINGIYSDGHDDAIKWKHFPGYWPFVRGIHRWPVNSPHKGQWRGALVFSLIYAWTNGWVNNWCAGDLRRYRAHCDVCLCVCFCTYLCAWRWLTHLIILHYFGHHDNTIDLVLPDHLPHINDCVDTGTCEWRKPELFRTPVENDVLLYIINYILSIV